MKKSLIRVAIITGVILLIPLVAMQFSSEVSWTIGDFLVAGALLFSVGGLLVMITRRIDRKAYRISARVAVVASLVLVWAQLAVGIL